MIGMVVSTSRALHAEHTAFLRAERRQLRAQIDEQVSRQLSRQVDRRVDRRFDERVVRWRRSRERGGK
jgi:hypothetical protein